MNGFASTEWSTVLEASVDAGRALERLCRGYWKPVYVYMRTSGLPAAEAEDATQEFFVEMLQREWLKTADRNRGRFRGFLRSSVRLFLNNRRRRTQALKRGGIDGVVPLETSEGKAQLEERISPEADPAAQYEQTWADCVLQNALTRLSAEHAKAQTLHQFEKLRPFLTSSPAPGDYARLASELGVSGGQIALWVHRSTQRFAELIRAEIAATLEDRAELESELRYLLQLVSRASAH